MKKRYRRLFLQHITVTGISGALLLLCLTACIVQALAERAGPAFALGCGAALFLCIVIAEAREAAQCYRIARKWGRYEREDIPPHHVSHP